MFTRALVPVDPDVPASWTRTIPLAEQVSADWGTEIHLITVVPAFGMSLVGTHFPKDYEEKALAAARTRLEEIVRESAKRPEAIHLHVAHGTIYEEILHAASELRCDLVVMTAHRPELRDYLIGPNAARVVRHAPQSVFVIREPD